MMNDYKELVEQLDGACCFKMVDGDILKADLFARAADAIEQLVRERDAAVDDIPRLCWSCKSNENKLKCDKCNRLLEYRPAWEWRGVKEDNDEIY